MRYRGTRINLEVTTKNSLKVSSTLNFKGDSHVSMCPLDGSLNIKDVTGTSIYRICPSSPCIILIFKTTDLAKLSVCA